MVCVALVHGHTEPVLVAAAHQFSVQLGSDQASYPKGKYLDDRGKINGKDPKEYTSLRFEFAFYDFVNYFLQH